MSKTERKSHEILSRTFDAIGGRKEAAYRLRVSRDLINRWCEPRDGSGKLNPIDRIAAVVEMQVVGGELHLAEDLIELIAAPLKAVGCSVLFLGPEETRALKGRLR